MDEDSKAAMPSLAGGANIFSQALSQADASVAGGPLRGRPSGGRDDIDPLADILAKLGLSDEGGGSTIVSQSEMDHAVAVLVEVLEIDVEKAQFFLSSSHNDIVKAVNLHFELTEPSSSGSKRSRPMNQEEMRNSGITQQWVQRPVEITGLPEGWKAHVSRTQGRVVFQHLESQHVQYEVPPGFADDMEFDQKQAASFHGPDSSSDIGADEAMERGATNTDTKTPLVSVDQSKLNSGGSNLAAIAVTNTSQAEAGRANFAPPLEFGGPLPAVVIGGGKLPFPSPPPAASSTPADTDLIPFGLNPTIRGVGIAPPRTGAQQQQQQTDQGAQAAQGTGDEELPDAEF
jgi:hypothetical protein